jgi:hypothetical protein
VVSEGSLMGIMRGWRKEDGGLGEELWKNAKVV